MTQPIRPATHRKFPIADRIDIPDAVAVLEISSVPDHEGEKQ